MSNNNHKKCNCVHQWFGKRQCLKCGEIDLWGEIKGEFVPTKKCNPFEDIIPKSDSVIAGIDFSSKPTNCQDWEEAFKEEFGIHFKDASGELQFAMEFIKELLSNQRKEFIACLPEEWIDKYIEVGTAASYERVGWNNCLEEIKESLKDKYGTK